MKNQWIVLAAIMLVAGLTVNTGCGSPAPPAAVMKSGEKIYTQTCLPCHQADGTGVSGLNPPLENSPYVSGEPAALIRIIINGLSTGVEINGNTYTNPMPAFGSSLNDHEIADVLTYIRNSFGNKAPDITTEQVNTERK